MKAVLYGAVRVNANGTEFAVTDEYSVVPDLVWTLIGNTAAEIPQWHKANPVVRVARFNVREALPRKPGSGRRPRVPAAPFVAIPSPTAKAAEMIHFRRIWRNGGSAYALIRVRDRAELGRVYRDEATGCWVAEVDGAAPGRHATMAGAKAAARRSVEARPNQEGFAAPVRA